MQKDNAQALQQLLKVFDPGKIVSPEDVQAVLAGIVKLLSNFKQQNESLNADTKAQVEEALSKATDIQARLEQRVTQAEATISASVDGKLADTLTQAQALMDECKACMPEDGEDADPADVVPLVLAQIKLPEQKDVILDNGEEIIAKINQTLTDDDQFKIDASHIKNLPVPRGGSMMHGGFRNLTVYDESTIITKAAQFIKFAGAGVQATLVNGIVVVTISGSASSESNGETLTDSGNHTTFTFAHAPSTGGVRNVWRKESGQLLTPTTDYTISGSTLTATSAQVDGDGNPFTLIANYTY